jgi:protein subunit release factor A
MKRKLIQTWTKKDFRIDWFSGTGAGGQHRNKHQNCVRITHIESGLTTTGQNSKSREQNFKDAFTRLALMLKDHYYPKVQRERAPHTEVIRTYNEATNRVVDRRTGDKFSYEDFDLEDVIGRVTEW